MANEHIKVFDKESAEYRKLKLAAEIMTLDTGVPHHVAETYFDFGQNWKWTTILKGNKGWGYIRVQALCPRQQEMIVFAKNSDELIAGIRWKY